MSKNVFSYRNGVLCAEAMPLAEIVEHVDTPFYCMSTKQLRQNARVLTSALEGIVPCAHYAVHANASLAVLRVMAESGLGGEVVSSGELERAIESGMTPEKIIMAGTHKTRDDIASALLANVSVIYASSLSELSLINEVAYALNKKAPVALSVSFNDEYAPSAFTLSQMVEALGILVRSEACQLKGFAGPCLNGEACENLVKLVGMFRDAGLEISYLGLSGHMMKLGSNESDTYLSMVRRHILPLGCQMTMQYGSQLVSDAGALVTSVIHTQRGGSAWSVSVDAGLSECAGPAFFHMNNEIIPVRQDTGCENRKTSVLGPHGGQADTFGQYVLPSTLKTSDAVAIMNVGAYGSVMASTFGGRSLIPEIMVSGAEYAVIRRRLAVAEQMGWEAYPEWLESEESVA